jgi:ABC-2 type transport system permease protein
VTVADVPEEASTRAAMAWGLTVTEVRLLVREPLVLVVSLLFPILMMVLLLVSFGGQVDPVFGGVGGTEFYVSTYLAAAISVMGYMGVPTHLAAYRGSGVLRRFQAAGVPPSSLVLAQVAVTGGLAVTGAAVMLLLAKAGFDLTMPISPIGVLSGFALGVFAFAAIGVLLGSLLATARAAQGLGLLLFFGTFFIVGGGPPPGVLPHGLNNFAKWTPTGLLVTAIRSPWTGGGNDLVAMGALAAIGGAGVALAVRRLGRVS